MKSPMRIMSFFGVFILLAVAWLFSKHKKNFPFRAVIWGVVLQVVFCFLIIGIPAIGFQGPLRFIFEAANSGIIAVLDYTLEGSRFIFGSLLDTQKVGFVFLVQVLPTVLFVGCLMAVFYHIGIMQKVIHGIAWLMERTMKTSGAETLSTAANIFVGQTEAPLLVKPFVKRMTESELYCVMVGGMASTAGGVMAAYVGMLRDRVPDIAGHLLTASVLSGPATIAISKIIIPEMKKPDTMGKIPKDSTQKIHANLIDAATAGSLEGLHLAVNVGALLLTFVALMAMLNAMIGWFGDVIGFATWGQSLIPDVVKNLGQTHLSVQLILGWIFAPFAFILGISWNDAALAGSIIGEKTALNEFIAYAKLMELGKFMEDRSFIILSYALCGFANFSSIAIQVGGIGSLAPERRGDLARLGILSIVGGTLASFMTAAIVGLFI